ncbi:helix-turn-helix transcriptional regulator [bacterium]|nr:helix-turn-helix transcriptional regulator [bacterium]
MDTFSKYLMNQIKIARKAKGISQEELANLMGVTRVTVNRWENGGGKNLTLLQFDQIAEFVGLRIDSCFRCQEEVNSDESKLLLNFNKLNNRGKSELIQISSYYVQVPELSVHIDHTVS